MLPVLYFVVPCYNEEENISFVSEQLTNKLLDLKKRQIVAANSCVLLVDDGSKDRTWELVKLAAKSQECIKGISLKDNCGHQTALYAGMQEVRQSCDIVITLDADGQHDISAVDRMIEEFQCGYDVVCAVRINKEGESLLKRITSEFYNRYLSSRGVQLIRRHSDYRLVSAEAIEMLRKESPQVLYLRTDFIKLPLKYTTVGYICRHRTAGKSKYTIRKMMALAIDGLASNGVIPNKNTSGRAYYVIADRI